LLNKKEARALRRQQKKEEKWQRKYTKVAEGSRFMQWRHKRPFWGATLTVLAALLILYIPLHLYAIAMIPGSFVFVGFLFGGLIVVLRVLPYLRPQFYAVFGLMPIFLSVLSVIGVLAGFIVAKILGIVSGSLLVACDKQALPALERQRKGKNQKQVVE